MPLHLGAVGRHSLREGVRVLVATYPKAPDYEAEAEAEPDDWRTLDDEGNVRAVADYLADMIAQLEEIARRSRLDLLVYLLAMAKTEAQVHAKPIAPKEP